MKRSLRVLSLFPLCAAILLLIAQASRAQNEGSSSPASVAGATISISATGAAEYVPDIARVTLGIREEASTADSAAKAVNVRSQQVISAIRSAGVSERAIKTLAYTLEYREPPAPPNAPIVIPNAAPSPNATVQRNAAGSWVVRAPLPGSYVASETLQITAPVKIAAQVLDAAVAAGANQSFGLSYESSNAEALYRSALAKAIVSARSIALTIAAAAHVTITGIQSISTTTNVTPELGGAQFSMRATAQHSLLPGTDAVTAVVYVTYKIR